MLIFARKFEELAFGKLMEVYAESCLENGQEFWPYESRERQIAFAEQDFYAYLTEGFFAIPGAVYAILTEGGRYISALRLEPYRDGLLLEALETAPDRRCMGYAEKLIREVLVLYPGEKIYSHVGKKNAPSLRVHEKCGFLRLQEYAVYIDGSVNDRCCTLCHFSESPFGQD